MDYTIIGTGGAPTGGRIVLPVYFRLQPGDPMTSVDPVSVDRIVFMRDDGRGGQIEHVIRGEETANGRRPAWTSEKDVALASGSGWATFAIQPGDEVYVEAAKNSGLDPDLATGTTQRYSITEVFEDRLTFAGWPPDASQVPSVISVRRRRHPIDPETPGVLLYEDVEVVVTDPPIGTVERRDTGVLDAYWQTNSRTPAGRYTATAYWTDDEGNDRTVVSQQFPIYVPAIPEQPSLSPNLPEWAQVLERWLPTLYTDLGQDEDMKGMTRVVGKTLDAMHTAMNSLVDSTDPLRAGARELTHMANNLGWKLIGQNPERWRAQLFQAIATTQSKGSAESIERALSFAEMNVLGWTHYWRVVPKYTTTNYLSVRSEDLDAQQRWQISLESEPVKMLVHGKESELDVDAATLGGSPFPDPKDTRPEEINDFWRIQRRRPAPCILRLGPGIRPAQLRWEDTNDVVYSDPVRSVIIYRQRTMPTDASGNVYGELRRLGGYVWVDRYYVHIMDGEYAGYYPILKFGKDLGSHEYALVGEIPEGAKGRITRAQLVARTRRITPTGPEGEFVAFRNSQSSEAIFGDPDTKIRRDRPELFAPPQWELVYSGGGGGIASDQDALFLPTVQGLLWHGQEPTFEDNEDLEDAYLTANSDTVTDNNWSTMLAQAGLEAKAADIGLRVGDELKVSYLKRPLPVVYYQNTVNGIESVAAGTDNSVRLIKAAEYEAEQIINGLPVFDQRDPGSYELRVADGNPPVDFDGRLIEDDDDDLPVICATLNPAAEPVIFGHVRTDAKWSTKVFNEETYDGSTKPSSMPCDIDPDFVETCDCSWSNYFSVAVSIGMLSDEKLTLCQEIIDRFKPIHALLHDLSAVGEISDVVMGAHDAPTMEMRIDIDDVVFDSSAYFDRSGLHGRDRSSIVEEVEVATGTATVDTSTWELFDISLPDMRPLPHNVYVLFTGDITGTTNIQHAERWALDFDGSEVGIAPPDTFENVPYVLYRDVYDGTCDVSQQTRYFVDTSGDATTFIDLGSESGGITIPYGAQGRLSGLPFQLGSDIAWKLRALVNGQAVTEYDVIGYERRGLEVDREVDPSHVVFELIAVSPSGTEVVSTGAGVPAVVSEGVLTGSLTELVSFDEDQKDETGRSLLALFIERNSVRIGNEWYRILSATTDRLIIDWDGGPYSGQFYIGEMIHMSTTGTVRWRSNVLDTGIDIASLTGSAIVSNDPGMAPATLERDLEEFVIKYGDSYFAMSEVASTTKAKIVGWTEEYTGSFSLIHLVPIDGQRINRGGSTRRRWRDATTDLTGGSWSATDRIWPTEAGQISESIRFIIEDDGGSRQILVME